jgi:hypothetical protein
MTIGLPAHSAGMIRSSYRRSLPRTLRIRWFSQGQMNRRWPRDVPPAQVVRRCVVGGSVAPESDYAVSSDGKWKRAEISAYQPLLDGIVALLEDSRRATGRAVSSILTTTYWEIGRRIVEEAQRGRRKADYGEQFVEQLAADLTARFGKGFPGPASFRCPSSTWHF